jgi:hypothetical protein
MWGEAAHHAVHLLNVTSSRSLGNIIPHEAAYGVVPDVSKLRVFDCVAFATRPHNKKLDDKAVRATNLGHIGCGKYLLLLPGPDYKIFVATSVKFDEQVFDFAADAVKEVTGIRNITGGDDIISKDMRLLASEDEDEIAEVSKAAPSFETCCTTGFKIELPNARAGVCLVTDLLIYQPARRRCFLQAELLHVI